MPFRFSMCYYLHVLVIFGCCFIGACQAISPSSRALLGGKIEFKASGGFAGIRQSLTVGDDGTCLARDDRIRKEVSCRLSPELLMELKSAFRKCAPIVETNTLPVAKQCADCFYYSIKATVEGTAHEVNISMLNAESSPYGRVVLSLSQILRETLAKAEKLKE